ncbi:hypothetical protein [Usitatibacter palustris]|uniref:RCC1-like domain-containing protein n=1 Tax=Usitatibacter palustris TaxID=2732487 RepID=A0A6M4H5X6_9PROT|nr:hypothetical protein [Usitatibacter palustris]QJR14338.1 hypothetical protein DSM104440_01134 [Usitatibacter palustris]
MRTPILFLALALSAMPAFGATPAVRAGAFHSLALDAGGTVRAWGDDSSGQLGQGRTLLTASAVTVSGITGVAKISAGANHVLALMNDGTVRSWGRNSQGQLGDGTNTNRSTPAPVSGLTGVIAIAAATNHSIALKSDGTVWAWGVNWQGQLGSDAIQADVPVRVNGISDVAKISSTGDHVLVLKNDGTVWTWGRNDLGQLGTGTPSDARATPAAVPGLTGIVDISAGTQHSMAVTAAGAVLTWGYNYGGQLGHNESSQFRAVPTVVPGITDAAAASGGIYHSLVRARDGTVWAWGMGYSGELGDGRFTPSITPVKVSGLANVTDISAAAFFSLARTSDGALWAWGSNASGQIGDGTSENRGTPVRVISIPAIVAMSAGGGHGFAVPADGTVRAWGANDFGELGDGAKPLRTTPALVPGATGIEKIAAGGLHTLAVKADGTVIAWGSNSQAQLGDGTQNSRSTAGAVRVLTGVRDVAAGFFNSFALKTDGTVWSWGYAWQGLLGHGDEEQQNEPKRIAALSGISALAAGDSHTLVLESNGGVQSWGANDSGQLGSGNTANRSSPGFVNGLTSVTRIAAGGAHSLALRTDGTVWAWGSNYSGQLGDGTNTDRLVPVQVPGLTGVVSIAAGSSSSFAIRQDGTVWAWGANYTGQLGDGEGFEQVRPVQVTGVRGVAEVTGGSVHGLARTTDGAVYAWGFSPDGRVGDGTVATRLSPVVVLREGGAGSIEANNWFLDLDPAVATSIPGDKVPVFLLVTSRGGATLDANVRARASDVGTNASYFVFVVAPQASVLGATSSMKVVGYAKRRDGKADPVPCVLAQLNSNGQLQQVSASSLAALLSGTLTAQGQTVAVLNSASTAQLTGSTVYVGYGTNAAAMLNSGTNRSVVSVPGSVECKPQPPQTGWWWNTAEGGRGYSIEQQGNNLFMAAYFYEADGRATWLVASGPSSIDGSLFTAPLYRCTGGVTLAGAYKTNNCTANGSVTLGFTSASTGTMVWPGGNVAIERFDIVPGGLAAAPQAGVPESGWWWSAAENGRGFFIEWQNGSANIAGYMYDDAGNPIWYITVAPTPTALALNSTWWQYANGQTQGGPYKAPTQVNGNVGPTTIQFHDTTTATMTMPGGRQVPLTRFRF